MAANNPYSDLKIFRHPEKLAALREGRVTAPLYVRIKPINICNHHCNYCSYDDRNLGLRSTFEKRDRLTREKILEIVEDFAEMGVKAVTFSGGGEPLLFAHIVEAATGLLDAGIRLSLITNGQLLCGERAEVFRRAGWVRISMDSCRAGRYAAIRRIPETYFHKICDNIRAFSRLKDPDCELGINFVVGPDNAEEVYEMAAFARDLGVNHVKFTAMITRDLDRLHAPFRERVTAAVRKAQADFTGPDFKVINKYEGDFALNAVFERTYRRCPIQQVITVIGADARVYLCHDKAYVPGGALGDLTRMRFRDLWSSEEVRRRFREFDASRECRHHCVYDQRNIMINQFLDLDESQVSFI